MLVKRKNCRISVGDILMLVASIILLAGINSWFKVCEPEGDMVMSCHWAGEVLKALAVLVTILAVIHLIVFDGRIKCGLDIAFIGLGVLLMRIPGGVISLCKMDTMHCRQMTKLWVIILAIVIIIAAVLDILFNYSDELKKNHTKETQA